MVMIPPFPVAFLFLVLLGHAQNEEFHARGGTVDCKMTNRCLVRFAILQRAYLLWAFNFIVKATAFEETATWPYKH